MTNLTVFKGNQLANNNSAFDMDSGNNYQYQKRKFKDLYDYQKKVIQEVFNWFEYGKKSILLYAPTGAGKTVMAISIVKKFVEQGKKVLILVHRLPLVEQTKNTLNNLLPDKEIKYSIIQGENTEINEDADVIIAMAQSLKNHHLPPELDLIIIDESHSLCYYKIVRDLKQKYQPCPDVLPTKTRIIGLSASPWRTKPKEGYCWLFQTIVRSPSIRSLIVDKYLTMPRMFGYEGLIDYTQLDTNNGDYTMKSLNIVCNAELNREVVEKYQDVTPDKQAIAFCATVKQADNLAEQFNEAGITAEIWVGSTPQKERDEIQKRFQQRQTKVIVSVSAICEGFDEPIAEVGLICRPTKSMALFIQMCGRVLRLYPSKDFAYLLDFCDNFARLDIDLLENDIPIKLCPKNDSKEKGELPRKICPNCKSEIHASLRICPECGYEFPLEEKLFLADNFGEILPKEQRKQAKYLRKQIRRIYGELHKKFGYETEKNRRMFLNPMRAKILFHKKFNYFPPEDWFMGAIFGANPDDAHKNQYYTYLKWLFPDKNESIINNILSHEFGKNKPKQIKTYNPKIDIIPTTQNWHLVLGVKRNTPLDLIKKQYKALAKQYHPDLMLNKTDATVIMQNINSAFELAKAHAESNHLQEVA